MMTTKTTKVKNGTITLPKGVRKAWKGAEVYLDVEGDTILIKRLSRPALTLKEMMDELREAARKTKLSKKDVEEAIREVRKEMYRR